MDRDLEQIISGLKGKKRRFLNDKTLSIEERSRKSGLDIETIKAYDLSVAQSTRGGYCKMGAALLVATLATAGVIHSKFNNRPQSIPPSIPISPSSDTIPLSPRQPAPVVSLPGYDLPKVLRGVQALETAFEQDTPIHVYTLSRFLTIESSAREHYDNMIRRSIQLRGQRFERMELFRETVTPINGMMLHPDLGRAGVYERVGAAQILERFLRQGRESHYGIYHCAGNNDLALIELPDERAMTLGALERICQGRANNEDLSTLSYHIRESRRFEGIGPLANTLRRGLNSLAQSLANPTTQGREEKTKILRAIMETDLNHSVNSVNGYFSPNLDGNRYDFVSAMHNHNWGRLESEGDLQQSQESHVTIAVYNATEGFSTRHLLRGQALDTGRRLAITGTHQEWYLSNPNNQELPWNTQLTNNRIDPRDPRYRFTSSYERGIAYAAFLDGQRWHIHHFEGEPTQINADIRPGFLATIVVMVGRDGRPMKILME